MHGRGDLEVRVGRVGRPAASNKFNGVHSCMHLTYLVHANQELHYMCVCRTNTQLILCTLFIVAESGGACMSCKFLMKQVAHHTVII